VRCSLPLSSSYLYEKIQKEPLSIPFFTRDNLGLGETYLGIVFPEDLLEEGNPDIFHMDATEYMAGPDEYLKINLYSESVATDIDFVIEVKNLALNSSQTYNSSTDPLTGKKILDRTLYIPLSGNPEDNDFEISLWPKSLTASQRTAIFSS